MNMALLIRRIPSCRIESESAGGGEGNRGAFVGTGRIVGLVDVPAGNRMERIQQKAT